MIHNVRALHKQLSSGETSGTSDTQHKNKRSFIQLHCRHADYVFNLMYLLHTSPGQHVLTNLTALGWFISSDKNLPCFLFSTSLKLFPPQ